MGSFRLYPAGLFPQAEQGLKAGNREELPQKESPSSGGPNICAVIRALD